MIYQKNNPSASHAFSTSLYTREAVVKRGRLRCRYGSWIAFSPTASLGCPMKNAWRSSLRNPDRFLPLPEGAKVGFAAVSFPYEAARDPSRLTFGQRRSRMTRGDASRWLSRGAEASPLPD